MGFLHLGNILKTIEDLMGDLIWINPITVSGKQNGGGTYNINVVQIYCSLTFNKAAFNYIYFISIKHFNVLEQVD